MRRVYVRKSVESGVPKALYDQNHRLEQFYVGFEFKENPLDDKEEPKIGVFYQYLRCYS